MRNPEIAVVAPKTVFENTSLVRIVIAPENIGMLLIGEGNQPVSILKTNEPPQVLPKNVRLLGEIDGLGCLLYLADDDYPKNSLDNCLVPPKIAKEVGIRLYKHLQAHENSKAVFGQREILPNEINKEKIPLHIMFRTEENLVIGVRIETDGPVDPETLIKNLADMLRLNSRDINFISVRKTE